MHSDGSTHTGTRAGTQSYCIVSWLTVPAVEFEQLTSAGELEQLTN